MSSLNSLAAHPLPARQIQSSPAAAMGLCTVSSATSCEVAGPKFGKLVLEAARQNQRQFASAMAMTRDWPAGFDAENPGLGFVVVCF